MVAHRVLHRTGVVCDDARMNPAIWAGIAALAYSASALALALHVAGRGPASLTTTRVPGLALATLAIIGHAIALHGQIFFAGALDLGLFQVVSLAGWQIAIVVVAAGWRLPLASLSVLILPIVAVAAFSPVVLDSSSPRTGIPWQMQAHILLSLMAYALLAVAAVHALLLTAQDQHLRQRKPGGWIRALPPLEAMEALLFRLIGAGFLLLGLSLVTGLLFVDDLFAQHLVHKTVLSIGAWILFGVLLWGRRVYGWRGRKALRWTLAAFLVLLLAYFGSKLVLEVFLGRRWG